MFLDGLRGLASQLVLIGHTLDFYCTDLPAWLEVFRLQEFGVVIFFVLSGYLIAYSADRQQQHHNGTFSNYLRSRAVRIYATLIPALLLIALLDALFSHAFTQDFYADNSVVVWLANLLHLQEYPFTGWPFYGTGYPLWSLSIEWWLYVAFGVLLFRDAWRQWFSYPLLLLAIGSLLYNTVVGNAPGIIYAWVFGAVGYWVGKPGQRSRQANIALGIAATIILIGWAIAATRAYSPAYHPVSMLLTGIIVLAGLRLLKSCSTPRINAYLIRLVRAAANSSFSLYLLHFSVLAAGYSLYGQVADIWLILTALLGCNLLAVVFARWFEWHWNPGRGYYRSFSR